MPHYTARSPGSQGAAPGSSTQGLAAGLLGVVIFGLTLPATRIAVAELDPLFVGLGRAVVAAIPAALALLVARAPLPDRHQFMRIAIMSLGIVVGFPLLSAIAMRYAPAAHGGVVLAVLPLATAIAAALFARERPSPGFWLTGLAGAIAVAAYGILSAETAVTAGSLGSLNAQSPEKIVAALHWADLLLVGAVISAAVGYAIGGDLSRRLGGWQVICWGLVVSAPFMLLSVVIFAGPINWDASVQAWSSFAYVAFFSMFLGFVFWNKGLATGGIAKIGQMQLLQPFVTLTAASLLLSEPIGALEIGFALLVMLLVAIGWRMRVTRQ